MYGARALKLIFKQFVSKNDNHNVHVTDTVLWLPLVLQFWWMSEGITTVHIKECEKSSVGNICVNSDCPSIDQGIEQKETPARYILHSAADTWIASRRIRARRLKAHEKTTTKERSKSPKKKSTPAGRGCGRATDLSTTRYESDKGHVLKMKKESWRSEMNADLCSSHETNRKRKSKM